MKKQTLAKRLIAVVLSLIMIFGAALPAVAAEAQPAQTTQLAEIQTLNLAERIRNAIHRIIAYIFIAFGRDCPRCGYNCITDAFPFGGEQVYVDAVNQVKGYKGNITVKKVQNIDIELADVPSAVASVLSEVAEYYAGTTENTYTFNNGVDAEGRKLADIIPPAGKEAALTEDAFISCFGVEDSDGTYVSIQLIDEEATYDGTKMTQQAEKNAAVVNVLDFAEIDLSPITVTQATVYYPGTMLWTALNTGADVEELETTTPMEISFTGKVGPISFSTTAVVTVTETYTFTC